MTQRTQSMTLEEELAQETGRRRGQLAEGRNSAMEKAGGA